MSAPTAAIPVPLLRRLADYAQQADLAGLLGECEQDPCQTCTDLEALQVILAACPDPARAATPDTEEAQR